MTRKAAYERYLRSLDWRFKRAQKLAESAHRRCSICNRHKGIKVHHAVYRERWEDARMEDITVVCSRCDIMVHQIVDLDEFWRSDHRDGCTWITSKVLLTVRFQRRAAARSLRRSFKGPLARALSQDMTPRLVKSRA